MNHGDYALIGYLKSKRELEQASLRKLASKIMITPEKITIPVEYMIGDDPLVR